MHTIDALTWINFSFGEGPLRLVGVPCGLVFVFVVFAGYFFQSEEQCPNQHHMVGVLLCWGQFGLLVREVSILDLFHAAGQDDAPKNKRARTGEPSDGTQKDAGERSLGAIAAHTLSFQQGIP